MPRKPYVNLCPRPEPGSPHTWLTLLGVESLHRGERNRDSRSSEGRAHLLLHEWTGPAAVPGLGGKGPCFAGVAQASMDRVLRSDPVQLDDLRTCWGSHF